MVERSRRGTDRGAPPAHDKQLSIGNRCCAAGAGDGTGLARISRRRPEGGSASGAVAGVAQDTLRLSYGLATGADQITRRASFHYLGAGGRPESQSGEIMRDCIDGAVRARQSSGAAPHSGLTPPWNQASPRRHRREPPQTSVRGARPLSRSNTPFPSISTSSLGQSSLSRAVGDRHGGAGELSAATSHRHPSLCQILRILLASTMQSGAVMRQGSHALFGI